MYKVLYTDKNWQVRCIASLPYGLEFYNVKSDVMFYKEGNEFIRKVTHVNLNNVKARNSKPPKKLLNKLEMFEGLMKEYKESKGL